MPLLKQRSMPISHTPLSKDSSLLPLLTFHVGSGKCKVRFSIQVQDSNILPALCVRLWDTSMLFVMVTGPIILQSVRNVNKVWLTFPWCFIISPAGKCANISAFCSLICIATMRRRGNCMYFLDHRKGRAIGLRLG